MDGDRAIIGDAFYDHSSILTSAGAAYIFERSGGSWKQVAKLTAKDAGKQDYFGASVALDGDRVIVGALLHSYGVAYIFERTAGGNWIEVDKLTAHPPEKFFDFGVQLAMNGDRVIVAADAVHPSGDSSKTTTGVFIFERSSSGWKQVAETNIPARIYYYTRAMTLDGDRAIVGAGGSAYILERITASNWKVVAKLIGKGADYIQFGRFVDLDGEQAIVGAKATGKGVKSDALAFIFERITASNWKQVAKLTSSDGVSDNWRMGSSVALDNDRAIVTTPDEPRFGGTAYIFEQTGGNWNQVDKLKPSGRDIRFGESVTLDGDQALVISDQGAYIFRKFCDPIQFQIPANQPDQFEPINNTFASATPILLTSDQTSKELTNLTLHNKNDVDFFRIEYQSTPEKECTGGKSHQRYEIGAPFYVDYHPASLSIEVKEGYCSPVDLEIYEFRQDSKHQLRRKIRTVYPLTFACPTTFFKEKKLFLRISNSLDRPAGYKMSVKFDRSYAEIRSHQLYDPPLTIPPLPELFGDPPIKYFDFAQLISRTERYLNDPLSFRGREERANAYLGIARFSHDVGLYDAAERLYNQSLASFHQANDPLMAAVVQRSLGELYLTQGMENRAVESLERASEIRHNYAVSASAEDKMMFGHVYLENNDIAKSLSFLDEALAIQEQTLDNLGKARNFLYQSEALLSIDLQEAAVACLILAEEALPEIWVSELGDIYDETSERTAAEVGEEDFAQLKERLAGSAEALRRWVVGSIIK